MNPKVEARSLITELAQVTRVPEQDFHEWLNSPPVNPGWSREDTFFARINSLRSGPMPEPVARELRRMFLASENQAHAA